MPKAPMSTRRTFEEIAENIAISWVELVNTPPISAAAMVGRYRDLQFYNLVEDDSEPTDRLMDHLFERIKLAAEADYRAAITSQFFHLDRPVLPLQRQWDMAIEQWRKGQPS